MAENDEVEEEPGQGEPIEEVPEEHIPVYRQENIPTGKVDQIMWYALRGKTRKELGKPPYNYKGGTIRVAFGRLSELEKDWTEAQGKQEVGVVEQPTKQLTAAAQKTPQIFAKGSPPEAIIESIHIPMIDGQSMGFEMGMKFGMSQLVLAVRIMQELSSVAQGQVKPLIDLVRTVREGEAAAFKGGADEGALKAAQAMGATIMPMMSDMQASIKDASRSNEVDPMKAMMMRTMEPLMKSMMGRIMPGEQVDMTPGDWTRKTE